MERLMHHQYLEHHQHKLKQHYDDSTQLRSVSELGSPLTVGPDRAAARLWAYSGPLHGGYHEVPLSTEGRKAGAVV